MFGHLLQGNVVIKTICTWRYRLICHLLILVQVKMEDKQNEHTVQPQAGS